MIGLLDPAFFLPRPDEEIQRDFDKVLRICRTHSISLPALDEYWGEMWRSFGSPLERQLGPKARRSLQEVRKLGERSFHAVPPLQGAAGRVWRNGFHDLFGPQHFPSPWEERMAAATLRAIGAGQEVVMLTRRVEGRNLVLHSAGGSNLEENIRWVLHLQPRGLGHQQVLCIYNSRNLTERWTTRFDCRLPGIKDRPPYPFCPPNDWWKGTTQAWRTVSSKPAWLDRCGNGWARPNIPNGAGYHWDVFIGSPALQQSVGLAQINVVEFGAPLPEGKPGHIHHVPNDKAGRPSGKGWHC